MRNLTRFPKRKKLKLPRPLQKPMLLRFWASKKDSPRRPQPSSKRKTNSAKRPRDSLRMRLSLVPMTKTMMISANASTRMMMKKMKMVKTQI